MASTLCNFEKCENGCEYKCTLCGYIVKRKTSRVPTRICDLQEQAQNPMISPQAQSIANKAARLTGAMAKWIAAGKPTRSKEEIEDIYHNICSPCEHFNSEKHICGICGCKLSPSTNAWLNKLRMKTEFCPDDPPRWT